MATIGNNSIQLLISEEEADIIQSALCSYQGPYRAGDKLTAEEELRAARMVKIAEAITNVIQNELMDRYQKSQLIEISYGR